MKNRFISHFIKNSVCIVFLMILAAGCEKSKLSDADLEKLAQQMRAEILDGAGRTDLHDSSKLETVTPGQVWKFNFWEGSHNYTTTIRVVGDKMKANTHKNF